MSFIDKLLHITPFDRYDRRETEQETRCHKICMVVVKIFLVLGSLFAFYSNPSLFFIGLFIGMMNSKKINQGIENIERVWNDRFLSTLVLTAGAFFVNPSVVIGGGALLLAAHLGKRLARQIQLQPKPLNLSG